MRDRINNFKTKSLIVGTVMQPLSGCTTTHVSQFKLLESNYNDVMSTSVTNLYGREKERQVRIKMNRLEEIYATVRTHIANREAEEPQVAMGYLLLIEKVLRCYWIILGECQAPGSSARALLNNIALQISLLIDGSIGISLQAHQTLASFGSRASRTAIQLVHKHIITTEDKALLTNFDKNKIPHSHQVIFALTMQTLAATLQSWDAPSKDMKSINSPEILRRKARLIMEANQESAP